MSKQSKPFVFVTLQGPDDGGDFGPNTTGTKTGGIQEALDYAHEHCRDVYIVGGRGGTHEGKGIPDNIYTLDETIRVPWSQDFKVDSGNPLLFYRKDSGHAIDIDSQMNCRYKFGLIASNSCDAAVCIKPKSPGPDDMKVVTACVFDFSAIVTGHQDSAALLIDSSEGMIVNSKIFAEETNTIKCGVHITDDGGAGQWISNNQIEVMFGNQMHSKGNCTGLQLGEAGSTKIVHNRFDMSFHAPRGAHFDPEKEHVPNTAERLVTLDNFTPPNAIGADIHAQRNRLTLSFFGIRNPGHDIIFEPDARDNTIIAMNLPNGITNNATSPTNRIIPNWPVGFDVATPDFPASGQPIVNRTSYAVQIIILTAGEIDQWTITDAGSTSQATPFNLSLVDNLMRPPRPLQPPRPSASQTITGGLFPGQTLILKPGEQIRFDYSKPATWRWMAL